MLLKSPAIKGTRSEGSSAGGGWQGRQRQGEEPAATARSLPRLLTPWRAEGKPEVGAAQLPAGERLQWEAP